MTNIKITDAFYLISKQISKTSTPINTDVPTDHIVVIDCSGSMHYELPKIRQQLKNKLAMMLKENDTVSVIWFSSKGQFGIVVEAVPLRTAVDLSGIHRAIDSFLKPISLTGFVEPLEETERLIGRLSKPGRAINFFFMSDGHDNQWSKEKILQATEKLQSLVSSAAVVEYGYYCNHPLMVQMAERLGANQILAERFDQYEPIFETAITKRIAGTRKIEVELETPALHGFAYALHEGEVLAFSVDGRKVLVPEGLTSLYWFSEIPYTAPCPGFAGEPPPRWPLFEDATVDHINEPSLSELRAALYAGLVPLSQRMLSNDIFKILKGLGDVRLIRQYTNCFGKQAYVEFQNTVTEAAFDQTKRLVDGYNPNEVPADDAYTILDLLYELSSDDGNLFYPNHSSFDYERIGRKAVQANTSLNNADQKRLADIAQQLAKTRNHKEVLRLQQELSEIAGTKESGVKFTPDNPNDGYPVSSLVTNEDRPNISAQVRIPGTVDLSDVLAEATDIDTSDVPAKFPTHIYRNYTIIRDGIRNVKILPVSITEKTHNVLAKHGILGDSDWQENFVYEIDLAKLPLINRKMVRLVAAEDLFRRQYDLLKGKAAQKVFNYYYSENFPSAATKGITDTYGAEVAAWLANLGIKDYGFSPKTELVEATESYYGKELSVSIKGLSSLPSVRDVLGKLDAKKALTSRELLLAAPLNEYRDFLESPAYKSVGESARKELLRIWLTNRQKDTTSAVRQAMREIARTKFSVIVGQTWFFPSLDENSLTMNLDGVDMVCTANLREIEIKV